MIGDVAGSCLELDPADWTGLVGLFPFLGDYHRMMPDWSPSEI